LKEKRKGMALGQNKTPQHKVFEKKKKKVWEGEGRTSAVVQNLREKGVF